MQREGGEKNICLSQMGQRDSQNLFSMSSKRSVLNEFKYLPQVNAASAVLSYAKGTGTFFHLGKYQSLEQFAAALHYISNPYFLSATCAAARQQEPC